MPFLADRVLETTSTTGVGPFALAGAATGYRTFAAAFSISTQVYYAAQGVDAQGVPTGAWEVGVGTLSGATTLTRDTVLSSSNAGSLVNFAAGTKQVYCTAPAIKLPDKNYVHTQTLAATTWNVTHGLGKRAAVTVVDSGGNEVEGDVTYVDDNAVTLGFSAAFSGVAYFN